jgi:hypothetical protein
MATSFSGGGSRSTRREHTYSAGFTCMPDRLKPGTSNYGGSPTIVCKIFATVIGLSYIIMSGARVAQ